MVHHRIGQGYALHTGPSITVTVGGGALGSVCRAGLGPAACASLGGMFLRAEEAHLGETGQVMAVSLPGKEESISPLTLGNCSSSVTNPSQTKPTTFPGTVVSQTLWSPPPALMPLYQMSLLLLPVGCGCLQGGPSPFLLVLC